MRCAAARARVDCRERGSIAHVQPFDQPLNLIVRHMLVRHVEPVLGLDILPDVLRLLGHANAAANLDEGLVVIRDRAGLGHGADRRAPEPGSVSACVCPRSYVLRANRCFVSRK